MPELKFSKTHTNFILIAAEEKNQLQTLKRNQVKSIRRHTEREKLEKQMQSKSSS